MCLRKYADYIANINGIARRNHYPINGSVTVLLHIGTRANKMAVELNQNDQWVGNKFTVADPNAAPLWLSAGRMMIKLVNLIGYDEA